ncbi:MAG: arginine--tRNA ligase [Candidatus Methylomirabilia bacterium]
MSLGLTDELTQGLRIAIEAAGFTPPEGLLWEVPREAAHGDYATNAALLLAKAARRPPRQVAEQIVRHWPPQPAVERVEAAGPGFLNVFLAPARCLEALRQILVAGQTYGLSSWGRGQGVRIEFVSANPTGPLVIVNARAAAVGDSLARILRSQGYQVYTEYYVNDAGNQFEALARSFEARLRQELGQDAALPENGYPGEYLIDLCRDYLKAESGTVLELDEAHRLQRLGVYAARRILDAQRKVLQDYGVEFDTWLSEQRDVRAVGLPEKVIRELTARKLTYEEDGALWFRSSGFGDEKDRVIRKATGELTYFAVDLAYHHYTKFGGVDRVVNLFGPDHHGYVPRLRAAMEALGHPREMFQVLIVQLVTLLRGGQPVRMSKRRGEFVLMEELIEEVGRDAARFTFLTRRHDSPLEFDLDAVTKQSADNPVYYVQYCHARVSSIFQHLARKKLAVAEGTGVDLSPLTLPEELGLVKRLLHFPAVVAGAARALEPHRIAYYLQDLAANFHPYYNRHRVVGDDLRLTQARLALVAAVGQVVRNGLALLGVSAPEKM